MEITSKQTIPPRLIKKYLEKYLKLAQDHKNIKVSIVLTEECIIKLSNLDCIKIEIE